MTFDDGRMNRRGGRWLHYDKHGDPIEWEQWARLFEQGIGGGVEEYRRIGSTTIGEGDAEVWVSTVWLGIDHNFLGDGPPIIFETMVRGGPYDDDLTRYSTEAEAIDGHLRTVEDVKAGRPLWFNLPEQAWLPPNGT